MPDFGYAKGRIAETVAFILDEVKEFDSEYADKTWKEYQNDKKLQKLMDRTVENIITALIELCGTVITKENISAVNYADVLSKCAKFCKFDEPVQKNFSMLAIQRNRLAHRYLDFRWQAIKLFSEQEENILKLLNIVIDSSYMSDDK